MSEVHQVRFRAVITLDPAEAHSGTRLHPIPRQFPNHTHSLMVRASRPQESGEGRLFPAEICWDDQESLHSGDHAIVTITVTDDQAAAFFGAGQRFTLWSGDDIGHGIVSRRVYTEYGPS